jgi:hypothetical protein
VAVSVLGAPFVLPLSQVEVRVVDGQLVVHRVHGPAPLAPAPRHGGDVDEVFQVIEDRVRQAA